MTTFPLAFLSRYERDADLMHDVAVKAQPMFQKYTFEKRGTEAVAERFVLSGPRGSARTLQQAQSISALRKNSNYFRFLVPQGEYNGSILIPHKDIAQSESDPEAGAKVLEDAVDRGTANVAAQYIQLMFGPAGGNVGTATFHASASNPYPTYALRFVSAAAAARLQEGDHVIISTADGSGSSDTQTGQTGYVMERDFDNGYVRIAMTTDIATAANPGGWDDTGATTYYVFRLSELAAGDGSDIVVPWAAYVPLTRQTSNLLGVDRAADAALSGARLLADEARGTIASRAKKLCSKMRARLGTDANRVGRKQVLALYAEDWAVFEEELSARLLREPEMKTRDGYEAFVIGTVMGELEVISDPYMQQGYARLISPSLCRLITTNGKLMRVVNEDGSIISRMPNSNDMEMRPVIYAAHVVGPPHAHGIFPL